MRLGCIIVALLLSVLAHAQATAVGSPIRIDGKTVFSVYVRVGSLSADERARIIESRFQRIAEDDRYNVRLLRLEQDTSQADIYIGQELIASLSVKDAENSGFSLSIYAQHALDETRAALLQYREERSAGAVGRGVLFSVVAVLILLLASQVWRIVIDFLCRKFYRIPRSFPLHLKARDSVIVGRKSIKRMFRKLCQFL